MKMRIITVASLALLTASCASSPPKLNQNVQTLFMPANQSLHNATVRKRGVTPADLARIQTEETKALLASVGNDRQRLLVQWMFYVNGSDQMKKDMTSMRGEEGWVYMMTFVYHFQFTADEIRKALSLFPDPINPELQKENLFEGMIQVAEEKGWSSPTKTSTVPVEAAPSASPTVP